MIWSRGSSSEKESKATQQADVSNGIPKPPVPFNFSFSATPNSGWQSGGTTTSNMEASADDNEGVPVTLCALRGKKLFQSVMKFFQAYQSQPLTNSVIASPTNYINTTNYLC
ncbi:hypothetical protein FCM35_KLT01224 [Carex littledalei]|uniref:Uncharacterized protein n=1 Tax=Carex littledalei TaxID=544730 RepID=A0A833REY5_9POAL|nr:hypothetical protein FCM35_KLT01224 [Carex littledalei]